jgi:ABC-type glycerol-3-phosphate transport system permease component
VRRAFSWVVSLACGALFLVPVLWLVAASFRPSRAIFGGPASYLSTSDWTLANYPRAFQRADLAHAIPSSLGMLVIIVAGGLVVNSMAAYAFARLRFRGRELWFSLLVALIILPIEVLAVPLFLTVRDLGLTAASAPPVLGLSLPFMAKAFNVYFLRQHFLAWPRELEEAAVIDGANVWQQFWRVALPGVRPALATVALLDVLMHWGDFLWPLLITSRASSRTVQIGLANLFTEPPLDWGAILACSVLATLPVLLGFRWFQRHIVAADASVGLR